MSTYTDLIFNFRQGISEKVLGAYKWYVRRLFRETTQQETKNQININTILKLIKKYIHPTGIDTKLSTVDLLKHYTGY